MLFYEDALNALILSLHGSPEEIKYVNGEIKFKELIPSHEKIKTYKVWELDSLSQHMVFTKATTDNLLDILQCCTQHIYNANGKMQNATDAHQHIVYEVMDYIKSLDRFSQEKFQEFFIECDEELRDKIIEIWEKHRVSAIMEVNRRYNAVTDLEIIRRSVQKDAERLKARIESAFGKANDVAADAVESEKRHFEEEDHKIDFGVQLRKTPQESIQGSTNNRLQRAHPITPDPLCKQRKSLRHVQEVAKTDSTTAEVEDKKQTSKEANEGGDREARKQFIKQRTLERLDAKRNASAVNSTKTVDQPAVLLGRAMSWEVYEDQKLDCDRGKHKILVPSGDTE